MPGRRDQYVFVAVHPQNRGNLDMRPITVGRATLRGWDFVGCFEEEDGTTWYSIGLVVEGVA